jgi:hypothetical protein
MGYRTVSGQLFGTLILDSGIPARLDRELTENKTSQAVHMQAIWAAISRASSPSCSIVVFLEASKRVSLVGIRASRPEQAPTQQSVSLR